MNIDIQLLFKNSFVITIDDKRYQQFEHRFSTLNINIPKKFIGFNLNTNKDYYGTVFKNKTMFCLLSHCSIVKFASMLDLDYVLIFEDDAAPHKNTINLISDTVKNLPDDIDVLKLGWTVLRNNNHYKYNDFLNKNVITWGAHAYVVFKKYYYRYMEIFKKDPGTDTTLLNYDGNIYTASNNIFIQYNDIGANQLHNIKNIEFNKKQNIKTQNYILK